MNRRIKHVHFVGAGGIGMCGLAELLHNQGYRVTGSDLRGGPTVERLRSLGIPVAIGHASGHVGDADVVVYSSAVRASNPELLEAREPQDPGDPPRRDARRADAPEGRHRGRRQPRQDDHHLAHRAPCSSARASIRPR